MGPLHTELTLVFSLFILNQQQQWSGLTFTQSQCAKSPKDFGISLCFNGDLSSSRKMDRELWNIFQVANLFI